MDLIRAIDAGLKLLELGQKLAAVIVQAQESPRVELKVLLYLQTVQAAIYALGRERQGILSDARSCDIRDREQVEALWKRLDTYLSEDNVRPELQKAITGLEGCREPIKRAAHGIRWRKRDKEVAVNSFLSTLDDLNVQAQNLVHDFYPEFSGQGLDTLVPVFDLIVRVRDSLRHGRALDVEADEEELGELVRDALRDPAHDEWILKAAHVERLIAELQLAFSVSSIERP